MNIHPGISALAPGMKITANFPSNSLHERDIYFTAELNGFPALFIMSFPEKWQWPSTETVERGLKMLQKKFKYLDSPSFSETILTSGEDEAKVKVFILKESPESSTIKRALKNAASQKTANKIAGIFGKALAEIHSIENEEINTDWDEQVESLLASVFSKLKPDNTTREAINSRVKAVTSALAAEKDLMGTVQGHAHLKAFSYNPITEKISVREPSDLGALNDKGKPTGNPHKDFVVAMDQMRELNLPHFDKDEIVQNFFDGYGKPPSKEKIEFIRLLDTLNFIEMQAGRKFSNPDEAAIINNLLKDKVDSILNGI